MTKYKTNFLIIILLLIALTISSCNDNDVGTENIEFIDTIVLAGNNPRSAEDVGADYVEPEEYNTLNIDFATFASRWNEAVHQLNVRSELRITEYDVMYSLPSIGFEKEKDYVAVFGSIDYQNKELRYGAVDWELYGDNVNTEVIANAWAALIYAINDGYTVEDTMNIINQLGIFDLTSEQYEDYELVETINGLHYEFYSTDRWGEFTISK